MVTRLLEHEVEDWALRTPPAQKGQSTGGCRIRILFAQPVSTFRHAIPAALASGTVVKSLGLPSHTLSAFQIDSGIYSAHCLPEGSTIANCTSQAFLFRTPQLKACSIGGLSVSHDFEKGLTTALILGYAFDLEGFHADPTETPIAIVQFMQQMIDCRSCWGHPLLLPCLFLVEHAQRVQQYVMGTLSRRVVLVEHSIGVTKTGRSGTAQLDFPHDWQHADDQKLFFEDHMQRQNAKKLVATSMRQSLSNYSRPMLILCLQSTTCRQRSSSPSGPQSGISQRLVFYQKY